MLTALRLFERGGYALGPVAWTRTDAGAWRPVPLGSSGRARLVTLISADQEDELRAFCNLVGPPQSPRRGARLGAGALRDGLRAAGSVRGADRLPAGAARAARARGAGQRPLAGRLAAICARPEDRAALAERMARAISLERAVIAGLAPAGAGRRRARRGARRAPAGDAQRCPLRPSGARPPGRGGRLLAEAAAAARSSRARRLDASRPLPTRSPQGPGVFAHQALTLSPGALM